MTQDRPSRFRGWQRVLMIIIPYLMILIIFQALALIILGVGLRNNTGNELTSVPGMILTLFTLLGTAMLIWIFRRYIDRESFASIGFHIRNRGKDILFGLIAGLVIIGSGFLILLLIGQIEVRSIICQPVEILFSILLFTFVAVGEEMLARGYLLNNLMLSMNRYLALLVSAVAFAALHLLNPHFNGITFFVIFLSGIFLGGSYIFTRNLWFPIALHFSWNFFQGTIFGFNVSGQDDYSLIQQLRPQDNLLNGGNFGFEGSLLAVGFLLPGIWAVWKIYHMSDMKNINI
jgi:hypothetical protein